MPQQNSIEDLNYEVNFIRGSLFSPAIYIEENGPLTYWSTASNSTTTIQDNGILALYDEFSQDTGQIRENENISLEKYIEEANR